MTSSHSRRAPYAALALAFAASCARADPPAGAGTVFVTAARAPQAVGDILGDILTLDADDIAHAAGSSLVDLLARQRGIEVARNGGPGTSASVYLRGANANQSVVLVDGVRIASSTTGTANWSAIPLAAIDHIEIVYGPMATLYGADAIGGVVQIFTRRGQGAPRVDATLGAGGEGMRLAELAVSGASDGPHALSYAISAGRQRADGFSATLPGSGSYNPDRDGDSGRHAAGQFALQLAPGQELGLLMLYSRQDAQYDSGAGPFDTRNAQRLGQFAAYSRNQITPGWSSLLQLATARDALGSYTGSTAGGFSELDTRQRQLSWQHDIRLGADALQLLFEHRREAVESSSTAALRHARSSTAVGAAYLLRRGPAMLDLSARNDDSSQYGAKTTGAAAIGYRLGTGLRASASVGTSFRAPTFNELYYPSFGLASNRPEQGRNAEIGLRYDDGASQFSAQYYRNRLRDLLVTATPCPFDPATFKYGCAYNVDRALLAGLTLTAARRFGALRLDANADLQDPRDDTSGKQLARRARRHANAGAELELGAFSGGVELELSGRRFDDAANRNALGGYGLLNLRAGYRIDSAWSLQARWNNATDKRYALARYYGTARSNLFVGLHYGTP